ncbi:MAG TPA: PPC domain-containing protein, partial [Isosphaeraceae bacterium]|nr:PPC domain-containing protein [Isosphaeraceae bacterium]
IVGPSGHSNAGQIHVGRALKTVDEVEPNNGFRKPSAVKDGAIAVNGKIEPGNEVDVYAIDMKAGETLAAEVIAARAGSGLDALITVFGPGLREIAEDDDTFGQDAAVSVTARVAGRYFVQVQDADGKHRDGKIEATKTRPYRLEMGAIAPATSPSPAGSKPGEVAEIEPNDSDEAPQAVTVPASVNGRLDAGKIGEPDVDVYRLKAEPGTYRISALAARLGSLADPVLTVLDEKGDAQAENDDTGGRDARFERAIDAKGLLVAVRDYYGRGGPRFAYRLEVERVPDRSLAVTADLGARVVPRGGSVALAVKVERRGYDGPVTVLAGETPAGVAAVPVTIAKGSNAGVLFVSATDDAPAGLFPFRLTTRDAAAPAEFVYRERSAVGNDPPGGWLVVAEPATLGVRIEPGEVVVAPGQSATVKVVLDRRAEIAKKAAVKVKLVAAEGNLDGFEPVAEATVAANSDAASFTLKAKPGAAPARRTVAAVARFDGSAEAFAVASGAAAVVIGGK